MRGAGGRRFITYFSIVLISVLVQEFFKHSAFSFLLPPFLFRYLLEVVGRAWDQAGRAAE